MDPNRPHPWDAPPPDFVPLWLVLEGGAGARVELCRTDNLVGRHSEADVRLPLPDVSRRHCRFVWSPAGWRVIDLDSLNGVFLNDVKVRQAELRPGDRVRLGGFTFRIEFGSGAPADGDALQTYPPQQRRAS
jgi:pSer/pThr/pTyr-binding forkhead associated (FHA) protein